MIKKDGYPIVASKTEIIMSWSTSANETADFQGGTLLFDNINLVAGAGEIDKGKTSLVFDSVNPIPWSDATPQAIKDIFPGGPQDALRFSLGELYESDEHQYRLGTKEPLV